MKQRKPDQIRRETVTVKHQALLYGFLGSLIGSVVWFSGWAVFHQEQVRRYPEYCQHAAKLSMGDFSLFRTTAPTVGMNADELRYNLLRYGNEDHRYDPEILRHRWYPRNARPAYWVHTYGAVKPIYSASPAMVFRWPMTLTLFTCLGCFVWGLILDTRYRFSLIAGIPLDGSIVATIKEYNRAVKGDGMKYAVAPWKDR